MSGKSVSSTKGYPDALWKDPFTPAPQASHPLRTVRGMRRSAEAIVPSGTLLSLVDSDA